MRLKGGDRTCSITRLKRQRLCARRDLLRDGARRDRGPGGGRLRGDSHHAWRALFFRGPGHWQERRGKASPALDYGPLAMFPGTLVFYMGIRSAAPWSEALLRQGKPEQTPVVIVRRCSLPDQLVVRCTLGTVADVIRGGSCVPRRDHCRAGGPRWRQPTLVLGAPVLRPDRPGHPAPPPGGIALQSICRVGGARPCPTDD